MENMLNDAEKEKFVAIKSCIKSILFNRNASFAKMLEVSDFLQASIALGKESCNRISSQAIEFLRLHLSHELAQTVLNAVLLCDFLAKNANFVVHDHFGQKLFMKTMKSVGLKFYYSHDEEKRTIGTVIMDIIQGWGEAFEPRKSHYPHIYGTYIKLKHKYKIKFPRIDYDPDRVPIFLPPIRRNERIRRYHVGSATALDYDTLPLPVNEVYNPIDQTKYQVYDTTKTEEIQTFQVPSSCVNQCAKETKDSTADFHPQLTFSKGSKQISQSSDKPTNLDTTNNGNNPHMRENCMTIVDNHDMLEINPSNVSSTDLISVIYPAIIPHHEINVPKKLLHSSQKCTRGITTTQTERDPFDDLATDIESIKKLILDCHHAMDNRKHRKDDPPLQKSMKDCDSNKQTTISNGSQLIQDGKYYDTESCKLPHEITSRVVNLSPRTKQSPKDENFHSISSAFHSTIDNDNDGLFSPKMTANVANVNMHHATVLNDINMSKNPFDTPEKDMNIPISQFVQQANITIGRGDLIYEPEAAYEDVKNINVKEPEGWFTSTSLMIPSENYVVGVQSMQSNTVLSNTKIGGTRWTSDDNIQILCSQFEKNNSTSEPTIRFKDDIPQRLDKHSTCEATETKDIKPVIGSKASTERGTRKSYGNMVSSDPNVEIRYFGHQRVVTKKKCGV
jgi:hypothetical protein